MNKIIGILSGMIFFWGSVLPSHGSLQEIDPFYLQRLESGERAFLEGNYKTAIEELNIALFGLQEKDQLKAKAYVYLGMSHYYLNNNEQTRTCLNDAKKILGIDGLRALITDESVWFYLERLLIEFKLMEPEIKQPAGTVIPPRNPAKNESIRTNARTIERNLEQQIQSDPQNVEPYYSLYEHHLANDNSKAAKKTIENLIQKNPDEAKGYYLLGRMQYRQRDLKEAEKNLAKVFTLQDKVTVEEYVLLEAKIYEILTALLRGDRNRAYKMHAEWSIWLTEERIRYLDLEEQDRGIFRGIVESNKLRAEASGPLLETDPAQENETDPAEDSRMLFRSNKWTLRLCF